MHKPTVPRIIEQNEFTVHKLLGRGTQGKVWEATLHKMNKKVVVKAVHNHPKFRPVTKSSNKSSVPRQADAAPYNSCCAFFLQAFRNELCTLESLGSHPNIVKLLGRSSDCTSIVLEMAENDLHTIISTRGSQLDLSSIKRWSQNILEGVAYLHNMGVTHTDLKPENVLISPDKVAKICDFGIAQRGIPGGSWFVASEITTLWYRAPELLMGARTFDQMVDLWAVGCILVEMLYGKPLFKGQLNTVCKCPEATHRNFNSDQLAKIFAIAGSPKTFEGLECVNHFQSWPKYARRIDEIVYSLHKNKRVVRDIKNQGSKQEPSGSDWVEVISGLLRLNPRERYSARHALTKRLFGQQAAKFFMKLQGIA